jgi:hypothetical protein
LEEKEKDIMADDEAIEKMRAFLLEEVKKWTRETYGPYPPCLICGNESNFTIQPKPMQPKTWLEDLKRQVEFNQRFPIGLWICDKHSDQEIKEWLKKRGIKFE